METRPLGRSGIEVSRICLGTMTFGEQNSQEDAFALMDCALDRGVFFWDAAEMYPVSPREATYGRTEEIIGNWFASRGKRDQVVIATKAVGPGSRFPYIRDGQPRLNRKHLLQACEDSLQRLQTDYIDLYQLHWPERSSNFFGDLAFAPDPEEDAIPLEETLAALGELVEAGKVRQIGGSNETAWGVMKYLSLAEAGGGPRMVSIQNPYSLLNRSFEVGLAEVAVREDCGLLAYAPIAAGDMTGKYLAGRKPEGASMTTSPPTPRHHPLLPEARARRDRGVCRTGAAARPGALGGGRRLRLHPALPHLLDRRRDQPGAARAAARGAWGRARPGVAGGHRGDSPPLYLSLSLT